MTSVRRRLVLRWAATAAAVAAIPAAAQAPSGSALEYQIKATFLYTVAKFVEWPAEKLEANAPIQVGIYGKDPFGPALDQTMRGKTVNGREMVVHRVTGLEQASQHHILFISSAEKKRLGTVLEAVAGGPVLTVGDVSNFAEQGGMVNLMMKENSVGLEINVNAAERAHLKISSRLLRLARVVKDQQVVR